VKLSNVPPGAMWLKPPCVPTQRVPAASTKSVCTASEGRLRGSPGRCSNRSKRPERGSSRFSPFSIVPTQTRPSAASARLDTRSPLKLDGLFGS
jgi:hypothetical protein